MTTITAFIKRHPVLTYYALTFAISWGGFLLILGPGTFPGTQDKFETVFPLAIMLMLTGPAIASILLTGLLDGSSGFRELLSRFLRWRVSFGWYAVALLPAPILAAAVLFALSLTSPIFTADNKAVILLAGIGAGFTTLLEELGWTGFAVPRLRLRYGILATGIFVGVLWSIWHLLQIIWIGGIYTGALALSLFLPLSLLSSIAQLSAYRVLLVWLYDRTGSLLVTTIMHASLSASTVVIFRPLETGAPFLAFQWVFATALWAVVAAVVMPNRGSLEGRT